MALWLLASAAQSRAPRVPQEHRDYVSRLLQMTGPVTCPCADKSLCRPQYVPKGAFARDKEVFGFIGGDGADYAHYDWAQVSTVAWGSGDGLICEAHKHGARVVMAAPGFDNFPANESARAAYVSSALAAAERGHYDGITFDYESPIAATDAKSMHLYLTLIEQTKQAFHKQIKGSQISVCVAWSPDDIDGRAYDYVALSNVSDLLYLMVYDTRSQIYHQCLASANSPAPISSRAVQRYTDLRIPPAKMILGIPWYSYDYPCMGEMESETSKYCPIKEVPFRGVNCSDAAGVERPYSSIMAYLNNNSSLTGRLWDSSMQTPFFNYKDKDGKVHQIWYDDPQSLKAKYQIARDAGFRGTGPFTFDDLAYDSDLAKAQAAAMWKALETFTAP